MSDDERYEPVPLGFGIEAPPPSYKAAISKKNEALFKVSEERERNYCLGIHVHNVDLLVSLFFRNLMIFRRQSRHIFLRPHQQGSRNRPHPLQPLDSVLRPLPIADVLLHSNLPYQHLLQHHNKPHPLHELPRPLRPPPCRYLKCQ